jgi:lipopolysaccharide transport system ATP-binding protein
VLAVGDARFQKKCLGRMSERASAGRTVLFVSHNLAAIRALTNRVVMLEAGRVAFDGPTEEGIARYVAASSEAGGRDSGEFAGRGVHTRIHGARLLGPEGLPAADVDPRAPLRIEVDLSTDGTEGLSVEGLLFDAARAPVGLFSMHQFHGESLPARAGRYVLAFAIQPPHLASGRYGFDLTTSVVNVSWDHYVADALAFDVHMSNPLGHPWDFRQAHNYGCIALLCTEPVSVRPAAQAPPHSGGAGARAPRCPGCDSGEVRRRRARPRLETIVSGTRYVQPAYDTFECAACGLFFKSTSGRG